MNKMKYTQLLDIKYQLRRALRIAKTEWDSYVKYGKKSVLYTIAHEEVKALRQAIKDIKQVIQIMREHDLYTNG